MEHQMFGQASKSLYGIEVMVFTIKQTHKGVAFAKGCWCSTQASNIHAAL
jgi:hypothetical protein